MKSEQINSYTEVKQKTDRDVRQLGILVSESYEAESTDQQTVINLNMSVDISNKKQVWVFIDGVKLVEGATGNYTFTNVVSNVSAQITLSAPLMAGLAIQVYKLGAYQEVFPNPSSVTATLLNDVAQPHKMALDGFQNFVKKELITAPYTTVQNRAGVEAGSLKSFAGIERVICRSLSLLRSEFGINGEPIFELDTKDSRVRFGGGGWVNFSDTNGSRTVTTTVGEYVEITFYGTGLNILNLPIASQDLRFTVDGGTESANFITSPSNILIGRNYTTNTIVPVVSGLSLGWHTVKIRHVFGTFGFYGFEILNQRNDLATLPGTAFGGMKEELLSSLSTSSFNAGVVGTRGARVLKYLKDGTISQVVTEVNPTSAFSTSTDHTNEEVVRRINFREFGSNRADDFSTAMTSSTNRAFTLDDGTTSLLCVTCQATDNGLGEAIAASVTNAYYVLTFVGTGLDIVNKRNAGGGTNIVHVDGVLVTPNAITSGISDVVKIASGLPYGTHTVKITNSAGAGLCASDFIIYQPKKPILPVGAIEIADYNVMSNYTQQTTDILNFGSGMLYKTSLRELTYIGGGWTVTSFSVDSVAGFATLTATIGAYAEYTFWGTGFTLLTNGSGGGAQNFTVHVDGTLNSTGTVIGSITNAGGGTYTITSSSGNHKVVFNNLPLGKHTIRFTKTSNGASNFFINAVSHITPTHINNPNMKVGSMSLRDTRVYSPIIDKPEKVDMSKVKAWVSYDGVTNKILAGSNILAVLRQGAGNYLVYFEKPFKTKEYIAVGSGYGARVVGFESAIKTPNYINVYHMNNANDTNVDVGPISLAFWGELEDEGEI